MWWKKSLIFVRKSCENVKKTCKREIWIEWRSLVSDHGKKWIKKCLNLICVEWVEESKTKYKVWKSRTSLKSLFFCSFFVEQSQIYTQTRTTTSKWALTLVLVESDGIFDNDELARVSLLGCLCKVTALYRCKSLSLETYGKYCLTALPLGPKISTSKTEKIGEREENKLSEKNWKED